MNLERHIPGLPPTVQWVGPAHTGWLEIIDQTRLPHELHVVDLRTVDQVCEAIRTLRVRGAPAIGVAAAYGMVLAAQVAEHQHEVAGVAFQLARSRDQLAGTRPTAVNLFHALDEMMRAAKTQLDGVDPRSRTWLEGLLQQAQAFHAADIEACEAIGRHGAGLIPAGGTVLTHCNAGALCATGIGTATAPMYVAQRQGKAFSVLCDETRPLLQGARLTAWELRQADIDATIICDSAAGAAMKAGKVQLVLVGADRIAANGDVANKIGTYGLAVLARHHGIPFYVAAPTTTLDRAVASGEGIPIEQRSPEEVLHVGRCQVASVDQPAWNPAFDVTPASLVTGIITERGVFKPSELART